MERKKLVAIITGLMSVLLGVIYLVLVQLLDSRGAMIPAPVTDLSMSTPLNQTQNCELRIKKDQLLKGEIALMIFEI